MIEIIPPLDKILFASALTEGSRRNFQYAAAFAIVAEASIVILHVREKLSSFARRRLALVGDQDIHKLRTTREQEAK